MTAICGIVREGLHDYRSDALPAPQRRILRDHLAACAECRETALSFDASLVFARRVEEEVSPEESAAILSSVRTGVAHIETERRLRRRTLGRPAAAVAAAAALLALIVPAVRPRPEANTASTARIASAAVRVTAPAAVAVTSTGLEPAAIPADAGTASSSATVYELNPGGGREEPRVVWIVDRGLDI
ncbi:MAG: zf-HC2 domain-containing protein [Syntrophomonadaceae bacterium]